MLNQRNCYMSSFQLEKANLWRKQKRKRTYLSHTQMPAWARLKGGKLLHYYLEGWSRAQLWLWLLLRNWGWGYLGSFKDKVMDDNLFFVREAQPVFADKGDGKGLTVHGFFSTWPVYKLIFSLWGPKKKEGQKFLYSAVNHLFSNFLAKRFLSLPFAIPLKSVFKLGS